MLILSGLTVNSNHGISVTVPITTHALHYGTSVFEGIRGYSNDQNLFIFKLKEHMQRLLQSAEVYSINSKYTLSEMCTSTVELLRKNNIKKSCYIRPLLFVGLHGIDLNVTKRSPSHLAIILSLLIDIFLKPG